MAKKPKKKVVYKKKKMSGHHPLLALFSLVLFFLLFMISRHVLDFTKLQQSENKKSPVRSQIAVNKKIITKNYPLPETLHVPILMYHYIEYIKDRKDTTRASLNITPDIFALQIKSLLNGGYTFITPSQLADAMDGKILLPKNPIILSFDDGYEDFYTDVFPILKQFNAKAVAYIVPGFINKPNYMQESELSEIVESKLVEIGAHTVHHLNLKNAKYETALREIVDSKKILEATYHIPVVSFAYPYGAFDTQAIEIVKKAGFRTAVSTLPGIHEDSINRFYIYRIRPGQRIDTDLLRYLLQETFTPY